MRAILLLSLLASPAHSLTLSDLRSDCRVLIKDTGTSRQRFSNAQLLRLLNDGQNDLATRTSAIRKSMEFELVAGTTYYSMPTDFLYPTRVTRDYLLLPEASIQKLDKNQEWQDVAGLPINYYIHFASRTKMGFYPFPDDSSSTGTIRMDYVAQVADLSSDSDTPFNGITELQPYGYLLSLYCGYRAAAIDGQTDLVQVYVQEYQRGLRWFDLAATRRPRYRPGATGGRSRGQ